MSAVAPAAQHTSAGVDTAGGAFRELAQLAGELSQLAGCFAY